MAGALRRLRRDTWLAMATLRDPMAICLSVDAVTDAENGSALGGENV